MQGVPRKFAPKIQLFLKLVYLYAYSTTTVNVNKEPFMKKSELRAFIREEIIRLREANKAKLAKEAASKPAAKPAAKVESAKPATKKPVVKK